MAFGLVLAGGGLTGLAWEVGLLVGLHERGVDVSTADMIVGTSAGSIVGSMLMAGAGPLELKSYVADPDNSPLRMSNTPKTRGDPMMNLAVWGDWSSVDYMDAPTAASIAQKSALGVTMTEDSWIGMFAELVSPLQWSDRLGIVSIDVKTGERKLWTKDDDAELLRVVASSCAVPGMFPAVEIDGRRYVDGGLASPTSADLLIDRGIDSAIIISPLGGGDPIGQFSDRTTARELEQLAAAGITAELIQPRPPIAPLTAFDESQRISWFETGVVDGRNAADRIGKLLA